jgi:hypothetical protein
MESIEPDARIADLVGILYVLSFIFKEKTDLFELEKYTASTLGFVDATEGDISVTQKGREYIASSLKKRKEILRQSIAGVEPFKTALKLGKFEIEDLYDELKKEGIQTYNNPSGKRDLEIILIEWGLYSGLIKKDDEDFIVQTVK